MPTIFPIIEDLNQIYLLHSEYVNQVLTIIKQKIDTLKEIEIGTMINEEDEILTSSITISNDDNESVLLSIDFTGEEFVIVVESTDEYKFSSEFTLVMSADELNRYLSPKITDKMEEVFASKEPTTIEN